MRNSRPVRELREKMEIAPDENRTPLTVEMDYNGTTPAQLVAILPDVACVGVNVETIKSWGGGQLSKQSEWLDCIQEPQDAMTTDAVITVTLSKRELLKDLFIVTTKMDLLEVMSCKLTAGVVSGLGVMKCPKKKKTMTMLIFMRNMKKLELRATGFSDNAKKNILISEGPLTWWEHGVEGHLDKHKEKMDIALRDFWLNSTKYAQRDLRTEDPKQWIRRSMIGGRNFLHVWDSKTKMTGMVGTEDTTFARLQEWTKDVIINNGKEMLTALHACHEENETLLFPLTTMLEEDMWLSNLELWNGRVSELLATAKDAKESRRYGAPEGDPEDLYVISFFTRNCKHSRCGKDGCDDPENNLVGRKLSEAVDDMMENIEQDFLRKRENDEIKAIRLTAVEAAAERRKEHNPREQGQILHSTPVLSRSNAKITLNHSPMSTPKSSIKYDVGPSDPLSPAPDFNPGSLSESMSELTEPHTSHLICEWCGAAPSFQCDCVDDLERESSPEPSKPKSDSSTSNSRDSPKLPIISNTSSELTPAEVPQGLGEDDNAKYLDGKNSWVSFLTPSPKEETSQLRSRRLQQEELLMSNLDVEMAGGEEDEEEMWPRDSDKGSVGEELREITINLEDDIDDVFRGGEDDGIPPPPAAASTPRRGEKEKGERRKEGRERWKRWRERTEATGEEIPADDLIWQHVRSNSEE